MLKVGIVVDDDEWSSRIFKGFVALCALTHQRDAVESDKLDDVISVTVCLYTYVWAGVLLYIKYIKSTSCQYDIPLRIHDLTFRTWSERFPVDGQQSAANC